MVGGTRSVTLAILALALLPASAAAADTRIVVKRDPGLNAAQRADIRADADVRYLESLSLPRTEVVAAEAGDVRDAVRDLNADPDVVYAQPARPRRVAAPDPHLWALWAFDNTGQNVSGFGTGTLDADMDVLEAWATSTGSKQTVAVVDTGIDRTHPDLQGQVFGGYDFLDDDTDPSDPEGHGTHVAGTIAAARDNGIGVAGVSPESVVVPLRALGEGAADIETAEAFDWAGDHGVRIVNASLAGDDPSDTERAAMAAHPQTLYVVAAGNDADNVDSGGSTYPCAYDLANVICVGASDPDDGAADFSNYGTTSVDVFAPGVGIVSTEGGAYYVSRGTSMATPHVTGAAALLLAQNPALTVAALKAALLSRGDAKPGLAGKSVTGRRVNAERSLSSVVESPTAAPPFIADIDGDGVADFSDNCREIVNVGQQDGDGNGVGDACDDRDGDDVLDESDNCVAVENPDQLDEDQDTVGDLCGDRDGDTELEDDNCPTVTNADQVDGDTDGVGDACDDRDGDGPVDAVDNCIDVANAGQADRDADGDGDACDGDGDGDGTADADDNCPAVANATQADGDADGVGDACDDRDGDELVDAADNCIAVANVDQADGNDNGIGDACDDREADGRVDASDNCVEVANADQGDQDRDRLGDACDDDRDGDSILNGPDNCDAVPNNQSDADGDWIGDACDPTPRGDDADGDGRPFLDDACPNQYGTLPNGCVATATAPADSDGDGRPDQIDACPVAAATTANGCPVAQVSSVSAKAKRRRGRRIATVIVRTTGPATVRITVERKRGRRWVRVTRRTRTPGGLRTTLTVKGLERGAHRVRITISSAGGRGTPVTKRFRVR